MKKRKRLKNKHLRKNTVSIEQPDVDNIFKSKYSSKIKEGYEALGDKEDAIEAKKINLKSEADKALTDWTASYENARAELRDKQGSKSDKKNKLVKDGAGNIFYIDNNGVKRMFDTVAAQKVLTNERPEGCPDMTPINISQSELDKFTMGKNMKQGYPCRKGCYNVTRDSETVWVDATGKVHTYNNFGGSKNFKNAKTYNANQIWWDNLMQQSDKGVINDNDANTCGQGISDSASSDLAQKNDNLIAKADSIRKEITSMISKKKAIEEDIGGKYSGFRNFREGQTNMEDTEGDNDNWGGAYVKGTQDASDETMKSKLIHKLEELKKVRDEIKKLRSNLSTYDGQIEEQKLQVNSVKMHHLIWMVLGGTFLLTAIINSR